MYLQGDTAVLMVLDSIQNAIFWVPLVAATLSLVVNGVFVHTEKTSPKRVHYGLVSLLYKADGVVTK